MSLQELESSLAGASRENRFKLTFTLPTGVSGVLSEMSVLVVSASVPGQTRGAISLMYGGKTGRIAGDSVTDETFPVSVLVPKESEKVYGLFKEWYDLGDTTGYKVNMSCSQLDLENNITYTWEIKGAWVSTLPAVDFNQESQDTIKRFEVTFTVDDVK